MKGYPPGTKCVVTWCPKRYSKDPHLGELVITSEKLRRVGDDIRDALLTGMKGKIVQRIEGYGFWPIDWMRPLKDPDAKQITKVMEKEV